MYIVVKGNYIVAQIVYETEEVLYKREGTVMGIDLVIKCLVVRWIIASKMGDANASISITEPVI